MDLFETLNPNQQQAVAAVEGPTLVLAGPGSGKTRVLIHRVGHLIRDLGVEPWRVMAVTFTNKAAREMKERLEKQQILSPRQLNALTVGTFHAICARILRQDIEQLGNRNRDFVIFDASDQQAVTKRIIIEQNLDPKRYSPNAVHGAISRAKNELIGPQDFRADSYWGEIVLRVYRRYEEVLQANNALDFDDLIMKTHQLFTRIPAAIEKYQERYLHVMVDEFQDTNQAQYQLVTLLAAKHRNLFVVGDEDQSIYSWRGADYRNVMRFKEDFPDAQTILLAQNYRSTRTILEAAGQL
ncbi:MAG TPA: DNA helicase UvrD, partial [Anaerolineae bacterium]|nr:DNA helicase UvrD [Anaerolineae bacterium]